MESHLAQRTQNAHVGWNGSLEQVCCVSSLQLYTYTRRRIRFDAANTLPNTIIFTFMDIGLEPTMGRQLIKIPKLQGFSIFLIFPFQTDSIYSTAFGANVGIF